MVLILVTFLCSAVSKSMLDFQRPRWTKSAQHRSRIWKMIMYVMPGWHDASSCKELVTDTAGSLMLLVVMITLRLTGPDWLVVSFISAEIWFSLQLGCCLMRRRTRVCRHTICMTRVCIYPKFSEPSWPFSCCFCVSQKPWVSGSHPSERKGIVSVEASLGRPGWQSFLWLYRGWGFGFWPLLCLLIPVVCDPFGGAVDWRDSRAWGKSLYLVCSGLCAWFKVSSIHLAAVGHEATAVELSQDPGLEQAAPGTSQKSHRSGFWAVTCPWTESSVSAPAQPDISLWKGHLPDLCLWSLSWLWCLMHLQASMWIVSGHLYFSSGNGQ